MPSHFDEALEHVEDGFHDWGDLKENQVDSLKQHRRLMWIRSYLLEGNIKKALGMGWDGVSSGTPPPLTGILFCSLTHLLTQRLLHL